MNRPKFKTVDFRTHPFRGILAEIAREDGVKRQAVQKSTVLNFGLFMVDKGWMIAGRRPGDSRSSSSHSQRWGNRSR